LEVIYLLAEWTTGRGTFLPLYFSYYKKSH